MTLPFDVLEDKIKGCWQGKNIGGVLGAPFEGLRQVNDVTFYTQDLSAGPPPNDDLDLQLVWLCAAEQYGKNINAHILGDYWLSYIIPNWVEYGTGKSNLRRGLLPPLSGHVDNPYENSCGCFIRSELWACLCPGHPEQAVRYAYEDAIVDHADEGMYAELFCAAVESAAFVESDRDKLIAIGLSYLPEDCAVAKAIRLVIRCYGDGLSYLETRRELFCQFPGTFGIQHTPLRDIKDEFPMAVPGFDAPQNIGIVLIGWLYGEGDFGKSLCIAVNCGEDTDCTAATLGAILGIVAGEQALPKQWLEPVGGVITTCCINLTTHQLDIAESVEALSQRIIRLIPTFLGDAVHDMFTEQRGYSVETADVLAYDKKPLYLSHTNGSRKPKQLPLSSLATLGPYCVRFDFTTFYAVLDYQGEPYIAQNTPRKLCLSIFDSGLTGHQQWADVTIYTPEGVSIVQGRHFSVPLQNLYEYRAELTFEVLCETILSNRIDILIDISIPGRHTYGVAKATLFGSGASFN